MQCWGKSGTMLASILETGRKKNKKKKNQPYYPLFDSEMRSGLSSASVLIHGKSFA